MPSKTTYSSQQSTQTIPTVDTVKPTDTQEPKKNKQPDREPWTFIVKGISQPETVFEGMAEAKEKIIEEIKKDPDHEDVQKGKIADELKTSPGFTPDLIGFKCWFRFPQLNGGYFEMAKILMDASLITKLYDTNRTYKKYEKQREIYGLLKANGEKADQSQIEGITRFFSDSTICNIYIGLYLLQNASLINLVQNLADIQNISSKIVNQHKFVGKCFDEFFKNHMMKVGEYYYIDNEVLSFVILKAIQATGSKLADDEGVKKAAAGLDGRKPKIIKAKFSPADLKKVGSGSDLDTLNTKSENQKDASKGYTIKQMFDDRVKDAFQASPSNKKLEKINQARSDREKVYK